MSTIPENPTFFEVKLDLFDGPIDLLLHLVKQNELPLEKLSLATVATQYMECIQAATDFDLEVAGEYLVIATTLLSIKSSILLNQPVELITDEQGNLVDPHELLLIKLREAAIFKDTAEALASRKLLGVDVFAAPSSMRSVGEGPVTLKPHDPMLLGKAFRKLLAKLPPDVSPYTVMYEKVSIVERMMSILKVLESAKEPLTFEMLVADNLNRSTVVASFVALLELCKRNIIAVRQDQIFDEIYVVLATSDFSNLGLTSEFDSEAEFDDQQKSAVNDAANG